MLVRMLGPTDVMDSGGMVPNLGARRLRQVLAVLAMGRGKPVPQDTLIDVLWPDVPPATANKTIQTYVWALRQSLGSDAVTTSGSHYALSSGVDVDVAVFERSVERAVADLANHHVERVVDELNEALPLWRGPALADLLDWPVAQAEATRLEELRCYAEELRASALVDLHQDGAAVGELERLVRSEPLREHRWELLVQALIAAGRSGEAARAVRRATRHLAEIGLQAGPELRRLELVALRHEGAANDRHLQVRALDEGGGTLPLFLTSFVGRDQETRELGAAVHTSRLVTVTGAGGVGKTRLVHRMVVELADNLGRATWWVSLAPANSEPAIHAAIAEALRVSLQPGADPTSQFVQALRDRGPSLLVLDNCEHVIEIVAPLVARLLAECADVTIVATSRALLGLDGEHVRRVRSLTVPPADQPPQLSGLRNYEATALFVERVQLADDHPLHEEAASDIAAICTRLDGIPLAIELAAARARTLSLKRLAGGLDDAFRLLTGTSPTTVPRHRTLLASIQWSYDLLDESSRAILRRIAVCPAPFELDAAEVIAGGDELVASSRVMDGLAMLSDKSLVTFDPTTGRYSLLETIRQFGRQALRDGGEYDLVRARHARFWADRVVQLGAMDHQDQDALREVFTDYLTMLEWAMDREPDLADHVLGEVSISIYGFGRWGELHEACDWVLADRPRGPHWAAAVGAVAVAALWVGRFDVLELTPAALQLAEVAEDARTIRRLGVGPAFASAVAGDLDPARQLITDAQNDGDDVVAFMTLTWIGNQVGLLGQLDELRRLHELGETLLQRSISLSPENTAVATMGLLLHHCSGDLRAAAAAVPSGPVAWQLISRIWARLAARLAVDLNDADAAGRALHLIGSEDLPMTMQWIRMAHWANKLLDGDTDGAITLATRASERSWEPISTADVLVNIAATFAGVGRWSEALDSVERVDAMLARIAEPAPRLRAAVALVRSRAALAGDDPATARAAAAHALTLAANATLRLATIDAVETIAAACAASNADASAAQLFAATAAERDRIGYRGTLTSDPSADLIADLMAARAASWRVGAALDLQEAVALAHACATV